MVFEVALWLFLAVVALLHSLTVFVVWRIHCGLRRLGSDNANIITWLWSMTTDRYECIGKHHGRMFRFPMYDVMAYAHVPLNVIYRFWRHLWFKLFAPWPEDDGPSWVAYWKKRALAAEGELEQIRTKEKIDGN